MKKPVFAVLLFPLLTACAQKETRTGEFMAKATGIHVSAKEFFKLTREDIDGLNRALAAPKPATLALSEDRQAKCEKKTCQITGKDLDGRISASDLEPFSRTLKRAQASKKEEQLKIKWATVRCIPEQCVADLQIEGDELDTLLGPIIGGMLETAISP